MYARRWAQTDRPGGRPVCPRDWRRLLAPESVRILGQSVLTAGKVWRCRDTDRRARRGARTGVRYADPMGRRQIEWAEHRLGVRGHREAADPLLVDYFPGLGIGDLQVVRSRWACNGQE